jgi:uncharacterized protein (DUF934 family)
MRLLKNGEFASDNWTVLDDDNVLPVAGDAIVSFDRLMRDYGDLNMRNGKLAVVFPNDCAVEDLEPYLGALDKVILAFPAFTDGRAYSQARQLRLEFGFAGEIQASGNVLPDQLAFMRQCGFDVFQVNGRFGAEQWQKAATSMTLTYQRGYAPERGFAPADVWSRRKVANDDTLRSDFEEVWSA